MFARTKYVAGKWTKRVGAHAQMGLPRLKLAQAMTHGLAGPILDVIRHVLLLQHPSDLDVVIIRKNANLSTSSMEYSSSHLLNRVTVASSAMSAILNLSERRVSGRCEIR